MTKIFAEIYSLLQRIMILLGTIILAMIGAVLGGHFSSEIALIANQLFGWELYHNHTSMLGLIIGLIIAFSYYGREAMILETYEAAKRKAFEGQSDLKYRNYIIS